MVLGVAVTVGEVVGLTVEVGVPVAVGLADGVAVFANVGDGVGVGLGVGAQNRHSDAGAADATPSCPKASRRVTTATIRERRCMR
jgi:hypothetical protein